MPTETGSINAETGPHLSPGFRPKHAHWTHYGRPTAPSGHKSLGVDGSVPNRQLRPPQFSAVFTRPSANAVTGTF
jgi:hypothetical protein